MPKHREQKPLAPPALTRSEKRAADTDDLIRKELEQSRAADLKKIGRLKALRMAAEKTDDEKTDDEKADDEKADDEKPSEPPARKKKAD
jgi:hypothetical protein